MITSSRSPEFLSRPFVNQTTDLKSLIYLLGTKIDYIENIMESRFTFENNKIISKCGCNKSFNFIND